MYVFSLNLKYSGLHFIGMGAACSTDMRRITTFRSTMDRIYDGGLIKL
jgi:hypothetical protein